MKVAIFYGGKLTNHLVALKKAGKQEEVEVFLFSYNKIYFETESRKMILRDGSTKSLRNNREFEIKDFDLIFIRTAKNHWQEVGWVVDEANKLGKILVDPVVERARVADALKASQMLMLSKAGLPVAKTLVGYSWLLYRKAPDYIGFPVIIKGSGGHRGGSVYKAENVWELEKIVKILRPIEIAEGRRYMAQEYVENSCDYRVIVMGDKVLGAMKRTRQTDGEFRNNFVLGGRVELARLTLGQEELCVKAARACGLLIAGVDLVFRNDDPTKPLFWEVNRGPQFKGFMQATGIDVPREIIKLFKKLIIEKRNA